MYPAGLVFGILDTSKRLRDPALAARLRSFTISWSRYGYHGSMLEDTSIDGLLDQAIALGYRWCFIQAYGHIIGENWYPESWKRPSFEAAVGTWLEQNQFLVMGTILGSAKQGYGVDDRCLLVDLCRYMHFGRPRYDPGVTAPVSCILPVARSAEEPGRTGPCLLLPSEQQRIRVPVMPGWRFIEASLRNGMPVYGWDPDIATNSLFLGAESEEGMRRFQAYLDRRITHGPDRQPGELAEPQERFLNVVDRQVQNARRGVFLWNLESYEDVSAPPAGFKPPVTTLYSVAAGFKPNWLLESLGFDEATRVVFFDYSPNALEVKRLLREEWDGEDFPRFVKYLFRKLPSPETFYQLWSDLTPDTVDWADMSRYWETEIRRWGGEQILKTHWQRYRNLEHEYVLCNLLADRDILLARMRPQANSVIWWSNAFFTVYSNWSTMVDERQSLYTHWVQDLAARNPEGFVYGSDYNNISVNHIRAGEYRDLFTVGQKNCLEPQKLHRVEIRF